MTARISITAEVDLDNLAEEIADSMDRDDVLAFIKRLDERIADLAFTRELARHFAAEVAREEDAEPTPDDLAEARRIHAWCASPSAPADMSFEARRDIQRLLEKFIRTYGAAP